MATMSFELKLSEHQLTTVCNGMMEGLLRWSQGGHGRVAPIAPELLEQHLDVYARVHRSRYGRAPSHLVLDFLRCRWPAGKHAAVIENARRSW